MASKVNLPLSEYNETEIRNRFLNFSFRISLNHRHMRNNFNSLSIIKLVGIMLRIERYNANCIYINHSGIQSNCFKETAFQYL